MEQADLKKLQADLAIKHGVLVGLDDPLLMLYTAQQQLLNEFNGNLQTSLQAFSEEMEASSSRWMADSAAQANRVMSASLTASKAAVVDAMNEAAAAARAQLQDSMAGGQAELSAQLQQTRRMLNICMVLTAGVMAVSGISIFI